MGLLSNLITKRAFFQTAVSQAVAKANEMTQLKSFTDRGFYSWNEDEFSTRNKEANLLAYERTVWTYSAVYAIATTAAKIPLRLYPLQPNQEHGDEIFTGRLWELINRPNPNQTYFDLMEAILSSMELSGDCYLELGGLNTQQPTQMYALRPDWMEIVPSPKQLVGGYRYNVNGKVITYTPEEIVHMKYYHPRSELYGMSPIQASSNALVLDSYAIKYGKSYFKNGGFISSYLSVPKGLNDAEFNRLKSQFRSEYGGVERAGLLGVIDNDGKIETVGSGPEKALLKEQRDLNRDEILATFGVPPVMVGLLDAATFNNTQEQKKAFYENTLKPKLRKVQDKINMVLCWPYGFEVEFDFSGVEALQEDQAKKATTWATLKQAGIVTPNEAREAFDLPPIDGGDSLGTAAPTIAASDGTKFQVQTQKEETPMTKSQLVLKEHGTELDRKIIMYRDAIRPSFVNMKNAAISALSDEYPTDFEKVTKADPTYKIMAAISEENKTLIDKLSKMNEQTVKENFAKTMTRVGTTPTQDQLDRAIGSAVKNNIQDWAVQSSESITSTIQDKMTKVIQDGITNQTPLSEVTKQVQDIFTGTDRANEDRATMIARTETQRAINTGKNEAYKAAGITHKEWISAEDAKVRATHRISGEKVPIDEPFSNGLNYPGDPVAPVGELVNCRCTLIEATE